MILYRVWNAAYCPPPIISPNLAASPSTLTVQHPGNVVNTVNLIILFSTSFFPCRGSFRRNLYDVYINIKFPKVTRRK